ncbi:winged helix-turn-helix transcriptional regulator [Spiractinospora alimapuensis]|uniref:ArsR/SmtB family transcription factor n=1 Tax=Spiractinospora alimapuensis TaxID=2820884 RepID=UPI001F1ADC34|nr:ArsR family transcriptional regulator [Spiractinospora alimapuensis]QVQ51793.1 winged helix-turn-helix transcriptional regulator [Spiractinospora alimapuensis]
MSATPRSFPEPDVDDLDVRTVLRALADDARLRIVDVLADGEFHPCHPDEFDVGVRKSTLSHHFRVLREAGVTHKVAVGREHHVRLRRDDLDRRFPGLLPAILDAVAASRARRGT